MQEKEENSEAVVEEKQYIEVQPVHVHTTYQNLSEIKHANTSGNHSMGRVNFDVSNNAGARINVYREGHAGYAPE